jgi:uncharacterized protein involved in exopolysaccharide biosynthesis
MPEHRTHIGPSQGASEEGESEGLDVEQARELVGFVLHAARRRPRLALSTFLVIAGLGVTVACTMPRTYSSQVKLLAQRSSAMHIIGGALPQMDAVDNPIKNVSAMIMRRDKLVALVKDANLVQRFVDTRPRALKLKDRVMSSLFGAPSDDDLQLMLVRTLEKKLEVTVDDLTSTVVISVDWNNPRLAYDLLTLVEKNFLEARYDSDIEVINDSIAVLEDHAKSELEKVDSALSSYQEVVSNWEAKRAVRSAASGGPARILMAAGPRPDVAGTVPAARLPDVDLAKALEEKRLQIRGAEEAHERGIETLRQQLVQAQLTLTPMHPTVVALQQQIEAMSQPSAEYLQLKSAERALMAQIATLSVPAPTPAAITPRYALSGTPSSDAGAQAVPPALLPADLDRDGQLQLAQSKLQSAIRGYDDALGRLDAAKVELDITHAAYKHQYTVVTPAELPKEPKKATAQLVGVGSILAGATLALLVAAFADVLGGLILESWQVRRKLRLDVLGELDKPA